MKIELRPLKNDIEFYKAEFSKALDDFNSEPVPNAGDDALEWKYKMLTCQQRYIDCMLLLNQVK